MPVTLPNCQECGYPIDVVHGESPKVVRGDMYCQDCYSGMTGDY